MKLPRDNVKFVETNPVLVKYLYWYTIVFCFIGFVGTIQKISGGVYSLFADSNYGFEAFSETRDSMDVVTKEGRVTNFLSIFSGQANWLVVFLFMYSLIDSHSKSLEKILLGVCLAFRFLDALSIGSRFYIVVPALQVLFFYFFIKNFIPKRINKFLKISFVSLGGLIIAGFIAISVSRAVNTNREEVMYMLIDAYISEGVIFYDKYAVDHGEDRNGDRIYPFVKKTLGYDDVADSYIKRTSKYTHMKINEVNFITFLGDFMLDFGFVLGNIILLVYVAFYRFVLRNVKKIGFSELIIVYMLIVTLNGFSHYVFTDTTGNLAFCMFLLLYIFSKLSSSRSRKYGLQQKQNCNTSFNV
jgi:oligosaccharide repeat unit polymerase